MLRAVIFALVGLAVCAALLLFDDVDKALPLINLIVWPMAGLAGFVVVMRSASRRRRRAGSTKRHHRRSEIMLTAQGRADLRLPRR